MENPYIYDILTLDEIDNTQKHLETEQPDSNINTLRPTLLRGFYFLL
jgi:hypothetical protein